MFKQLATALLLRRVSRDLASIANSCARTNDLLARLVDRFAPPLTIEPSPADRATLRTETGVSHVDQDDVALAEYFVARTQASTGHTPDEEEVLIYLADEKTRDLGERLATRDEDLRRLMETRR
jgi:hypothetical protein